MDATFATIPAGGEVIAKFTISAAQVGVLWSNNWHPCLVASVTADNDYAFDSASLAGSPIVIKRNNLAQRNLSVINVLAGASAAFPFLAGHVANADGAMELVVNRGGLPASSRLLLALDEENEYFPAVNLTDAADADCVGEEAMVFLDATRVKTQLGCCHGVLTLAKGSRFDCLHKPRIGEVSVEGGEVILRDGKRYVDIQSRRVVVRMQKAPRTMLPLVLTAEIPADAKDGQSFDVSVEQRDERSSVVGGASAMFHVS